MPTANDEHATIASHLNVYQVKSISDGRNIYTKIGAAFPHKDGPGFNLDLDAFPNGGRIVCLPPREKEAEVDAK